MPDRILIDSLELTAQLGVPDAERAEPQRLTITLSLEPEKGLANLRDEVARTIDYAQVCIRVKKVARARPRKLMETLAEDIAAELLGHFHLRALELKLQKYILPDTRFVAVQIRREK